MNAMTHRAIHIRPYKAEAGAHGEVETAVVARGADADRGDQGRDRERQSPRPKPETGTGRSICTPATRMTCGVRSEHPVRNHRDAEDVTHDVFAKLMRKIQKYEEREVPFAAWILRVARNAALDHVRSRRQIPVEEVRINEDGHEQTSFEYSRALKEALDKPTGVAARGARPCAISAGSPTEIAERLGKTEASIETAPPGARRAQAVAARAGSGAGDRGLSILGRTRCDTAWRALSRNSCGG